MQIILGAATLALAGLLGLMVALGLGWNNPRPIRAPDWQAGDFPRLLEIAPGATGAALLGRPARDFTLEVEAAPLSCPELDGYGLLYRAQDEAHYYAFAIGSDGYYSVLQIRGDEERALVEWQQFPHIRRGQQSNRLRVTCVGPICHFYINDEYATMVEDADWSAGDVGLWARNFGAQPLTVHFSKAQIWSESLLPAP